MNFPSDIAHHDPDKNYIQVNRIIKVKLTSYSPFYIIHSRKSWLQIADPWEKFANFWEYLENFEKQEMLNSMQRTPWRDVDNMIINIKPKISLSMSLRMVTVCA